jgi:hypothetical protein
MLALSTPIDAFGSKETSMPRGKVLNITSVLIMLVAAVAEADAQSRSAVVLKWNKLLQDTLPAPGNPLTPRTYAMMHIAMFDAVNAIEQEFEPYHVRLGHGGGGSPDAAAAQAAHDVLVALNPSSAEAYHAALAADLGESPSGFVRSGAEIGERVAKEIIAWRQNDGWLIPQPPAYSEPPVSGRWQPTPPANASATFTHLQHAAPMAALSATQFQQTAIARLWSGVGTTTGFFAVWNNVAGDLVHVRALSLVEAARLFALVNVSIHDSLQTTQASKFVYGVWRPVTAIRAADTDLNAETDADPAWLPLITTPPYPAYAGNLATIGASAARMLQLAVGTNAVPVAVAWKQTGGLPDIVRHFDGFWEAAEEEAMARIYGGIHYRFDQEAGQRVGRSVAEFVFTNFMTPRR